MSVRDPFRRLVRLLLLALLPVMLLSSLPASFAAKAPPECPTGYVNYLWTLPKTFANIDDAFNDARDKEETTVGGVLPDMVMPFTQAEWNAMSDDARVLWLINDEREARGLPPMEGWDPDVADVAQDFADWQVAHNQWDHCLEMDAGHGGLECPDWRMQQNPGIAACNEGGFGENLAIFFNSAATPRTDPIMAESVYNWMYRDLIHDCGHRDMILRTYNAQDSCVAGREGMLGVGHAGGPGFCDPRLNDPPDFQCSDWAYGETVILNAFDPCGDWGTSQVPGTTCYSPDTQELSFVIGWNLLSSGIQPPPDAEAALDEIERQGGSASEMYRWLSNTDAWDGHIKDLPFNNFLLELGQGYFFKSAAPSSWWRSGLLPTEPVPVQLKPVWTLLGVPYLPCPMTAEDLLQDATAQGGDCRELYHWDADLGAWAGHLRGAPFGDFALNAEDGYFVKCVHMITYVPGQGGVCMR